MKCFNCGDEGNIPHIMAYDRKPVHVCQECLDWWTEELAEREEEAIKKEQEEYEKTGINPYDDGYHPWENLYEGLGE